LRVATHAGLMSYRLSVEENVCRMQLRRVQLSTSWLGSCFYC
jgi:hypothetical protein